MNDATLKRFADLIVTFGANVQAGQIVSVGCAPGKEYLVRAVAASAYRRGAKFVDVTWYDPQVKRARLKYAPEDTLDFVPPWYGERMLALGEHRCARVALAGPVAPGLFADLDPVRAGRDRLPWIKEAVEVVNAQTTNWTIVPCPTLEWARLVFPDLDDTAALAKLEESLMWICRMDEPDPVEAWNTRMRMLTDVAQRVTERHFDALHYEGPGTELTIGLLPSHRWKTALFETAEGIPHMPNIPTEEIFTTPDPVRVEGNVTSTRPLVLTDGTVVEGLKVIFKDGRAVDVQAQTGMETLRTILDSDENAVRLGEVALVDGESRIGVSGNIFFDTLLDENAASHIAFGQGYVFAVDDEADKAQVNTSGIHIDFMVGSNDLKVSGLTSDGESVPLLAGGRWLI